MFLPALRCFTASPFRTPPTSAIGPDEMRQRHSSVFRSLRGGKKTGIEHGGCSCGVGASWGGVGVLGAGRGQIAAVVSPRPTDKAGQSGDRWAFGLHRGHADLPMQRRGSIVLARAGLSPLAPALPEGRDAV